MNTNISLPPQTIHIWRAWLPDLAALESDYLQFLSPDEIARATRFRFPIHKQRYILTRGILRQLLSCYTGLSAKEIEFSYGAKGKPSLANNPELQFNISHSHDIAVFAFTKTHEIGIDIEKFESEYKDSVAKRFFSAEENSELEKLPLSERAKAFYQIWASKEALIKAIGQGLYIGLDEFSISIHKNIQEIIFSNTKFHIENFKIHADYFSAFATAQHVEKIIFAEWREQGPVLLQGPPAI